MQHKDIARMRNNGFKGINFNVSLPICVVMLFQIVRFGACSDKDAKTPLLANFTTMNVNDELTKYETYDNAAVATDNEICSKIAKDILVKGGSAVDSGIAAAFCLGVIQFHSTGIGGGGFILVYEREKKKFTGLDFRETVPSKVDLTELENDSKKIKQGGISVAVPSEVKGLREAWKKFGKLDWAKLLDPSIKLAKEGFPASPHLVIHTKNKIDKIQDPFLRDLLHIKDGSLIAKGSTLQRPKYAETLTRIRDKPDDMYEGELARDVIEDIKSKGGVMTIDDLKNYKVREVEPLKLRFEELNLYTLPLPAAGSILVHMLLMGKAFNFSRADMDTMNKTILTYHRATEIFKFSHAYRSHLSDPDFAVNKEEFTKMNEALLDPEVAKLQVQKINDTSTQEKSFYGSLLTGTEEKGTTHVSILAENGDAVAVTSSINDKFGARFASSKTGIVYNNELADSHTLSSPWRKFSWSEENAPRPGSRPLSAMVPTILTDDEGNVRMVIGASGGTKITLSVAWVLMMKFWFGMDIGNAVMMGRPYHSMYPEKLRIEKPYPIKDEIIAGLEKRNHKIKHSKVWGCGVVLVINRDCPSCKLQAKSDPRKFGRTDGY